MKPTFSNELLGSLRKNGILPVVCFSSQKELLTAMEALLPTPIRCLEITLRHPFSPEAIAYIKTNYPQFTVGAGTVLSIDSLARAVESGADFCVSPGYDGELIAKANEKGLPFLPGCSTPTEIQQAVKNGLTALKFFPAECAGGVKALKLYQGAFADVCFLPTGGITKENYLNYLSLPNVLACGGSFMLPKELLAAGDAKGLCNTLTSYLNAVKEVRR